jgi:hypothetical protein
VAESKKMRQEFPQMAQTEVMKKVASSFPKEFLLVPEFSDFQVSESWRQLEVDDRRPFELEAAADKERYQRELAAYEEEP